MIQSSGLVKDTLNINVISSNGTVQISRPNPLVVTVEEESAVFYQAWMEEQTDLKNGCGRDEEDVGCKDRPIIPSNLAALDMPAC